MLFFRYAGAVEQVLKCDFETGLEIICKAYEKTNEEKAYQRWIVGYEKEMSFSEFKQELMRSARMTVSTSNMTEKEILANVKTILEMR